MTVGVDVIGQSPCLAISLDKANVSILCDLVGQATVDPSSGKTIRLSMRAADAMRLLSLLKSAQQQLGLSDWIGPVSSTTVPPVKERS